MVDRDPDGAATGRATGRASREGRAGATQDVSRRARAVSRNRADARPFPVPVLRRSSYRLMRAIRSPILAYNSRCWAECFRRSSSNWILPGAKIEMVAEPPNRK